MNVHRKFAALIAATMIMSANAVVARAVDLTYTNPVIDRNFPDPCVLKVDGTFYAYATNNNKRGETIPCAKSTDLVHWSADIDAMPTLPTWADKGHTWAPDVAAVKSGSYVMYFVARNHAIGHQSIGVATSTSPSGPFTSNETEPLVEQTDLGGDIDPYTFVDTDGARYLLWKNDGNSRHKDTWLWIQRLSQDGLTLLGQPRRLIKQDKPWEDTLIEAPTLFYHHGKYYLFYSGHDFSSCAYAIGYAVSDSLYGPYVKPQSTPWVSSTAQVCGPGGQDIIDLGRGDTWMVYHRWEKGPRTYRSMCLDRLVWKGDVPELDGPSISEEADPAVSAVRSTSAKAGIEPAK